MEQETRGERREREIKKKLREARDVVCSIESSGKRKKEKKRKIDIAESGKQAFNCFSDLNPRLIGTHKHKRAKYRRNAM